MVNIFYYNEAFNVPDGASGHAFGLLNGFKAHPKVNEVLTFPMLGEDRHEPIIAPGRYARTSGFSTKEQLLRLTKRTLQSKWRYWNHCGVLRDFVGRGPLVQLARVTSFDTSPCLLSKKLQIPLVAEWNTPFFYEIGSLRNGAAMQFCERWEGNFLHSSDLIYTVSNELKSMLIKKYHLPEERLLAVANGYDANIYPSTEDHFHAEREDVRREMGWSDKMVVVFIGSLKVWHGIETLMNVVDHFSSRLHEIHFVVIGDGEARDVVKASCEKFANLSWLGALQPESMARYLVGCDLGIMPYKEIDSFYFSPLKLYDMIGAALPSIGFSAGQIGEVYEAHPEAGWNVRKSTAEEYVNLIGELQLHRSHLIEKRNRLLTSRWKHTWNSRVSQLVERFEVISEKYSTSRH